MTLQIFEGDSAGMHQRYILTFQTILDPPPPADRVPQNSASVDVGRVKGLACQDPGVRTTIGAIGIISAFMAVVHLVTANRDCSWDFFY